jgi:hypothetical protein
VDYAKTGKQVINVKDINIDNWDDYFNGILNIMKDGIETDFVQSNFITLDFNVSETIDLSVTDLFFNVIMWYLIVRTGSEIQPYHIFFDDTITKRTIKRYIDDFFIKVNRHKFTNLELNNIIDDTLHKFNYINIFSMYLANTINLEDSINLMKKSKEFYDMLHADLSNLPLEDVKKVGMDITNKSIHMMKNAKEILGYDHCLADSWRASEAINPKQYKEFATNIGTKPDGKGGVYSHIINTSFINGGLNDLLSNYIESNAGRIAQILSKTNVGDSGHFARILGLNNTDTFLNNDPTYDCGTRNYEEQIITSKEMFKKFIGRYYRFHPDGVEYLLTDLDEEKVLEKKIYLRSPMTCLSEARGLGVCHKCYGELYHTNRDINIGKLAAEIVTSKLTQILLSAKHLLETAIKELKWYRGFSDIFDVDANVIKLLQDTNFKGYNMIIDPENISLENEDDFIKSNYDDDDMEYGNTSFKTDNDNISDEEQEIYNEYITEFTISTPEGTFMPMGTKELDKLYISKDLNDIIRKKGEAVDNKIVIPLHELVDSSIFFIIIHNNELSKTMEDIMDTINKNDITKNLNRHALLQRMNETVIKGGLDIMSVHSEIILMNQIRNKDNILEKPEWNYPNEECDILTLNQALTNNPSVTVTLMYQRLSKTLYNPLTFAKGKPSFMDLFFMEKPQEYLSNNIDIRPAVEPTDRDKELRTVITKIPYAENEEDDCSDLEE